MVKIAHYCASCLTAMYDAMYQVVLCTCPSPEVAEEIASQLVEEQLVACVNVLPSITSIYRWQDKVEKEEEVLLVDKSIKSNVYCAIAKN